ncbi:D-glycero-beta-D-manno-heptose-1,7-bisphosphate 7-phosphatase [subsurface metagenome]
MRNRAVFLDSDGTIARDVHYCCRVEDFELLPTVPQAIKLLNASGFKVVVITNQSGIARGYFTDEILAQIHRKMEEELAQHGAHVDAIYYCPHHHDDGCKCRKPKPTLVFRAAQELKLSLDLSYMVGDMGQNIRTGKVAGCITVLVAPGPCRAEIEATKENPDYIALNLLEAARWIIKQHEKSYGEST